MEKTEKHKWVNMFDISVQYKGKELQFTGELLQVGYVHKILIDVNGLEVSLEKDDAGKYRAVLIDLQAENKIDKELVKAIVESVEELLK